MSMNPQFHIFCECNTCSIVPFLVFSKPVVPFVDNVFTHTTRVTFIADQQSKSLSLSQK